MSPPSEHILMAHGAGGTQSRELVAELFARHFSNPTLEAMNDAAIIDAPTGKIALTTDAYVVRPLFFPGGNIGKLSICGTVNDLAVSGAAPVALTASFVIQEGFSIEELERIVISMAQTARDAGVAIVAGDTKVVEHAGIDGLTITTAGLGRLVTEEPLMSSRIEAGDVVLINGNIADHGMAIMAQREGLSFTTTIESDCACLWPLVESLLTTVPNVRFMRDATRGGLAAVLNECCEHNPFGLDIDETAIPLNETTAAACEIVGLDPLAVANEGKLIAVVPASDAQRALDVMRGHPLGTDAAIIGQATAEDAGRVRLRTAVGSTRLVAMPSGELLPRIC